MRCCKALLAGACLLAGNLAHAHKSSDAYVRLSGGGNAAVQLRVDVALRDLDVALDLDRNTDGKLSWAEVRFAWPAIENYVRAHIQLEGCALPAATRALESRVDGAYAALQWQTDCHPAAAPAIHYSMLADFDPTHRGIARIDWGGAASVPRVLVPQVGEVPSSMAPDASSTEAPLQFMREGIRHILTGYDHVLFLICLLLPSVMRRTPQGWQPVARWTQALWPVVGIVSAFTAAHSITLALAATGLLTLSPAFIEPAIAVTIILAAFDNLRPIFAGRRVWVTFAFGLIHGFGFAGVLAELNLPPSQFAWALLQFNLGLELGQLLIVTAVCAGLFALRRRKQYPRWFIGYGSVAAMAMGALWLLERSAPIALLPL